MGNRSSQASNALRVAGTPVRRGAVWASALAVVAMIVAAGPLRAADGLYLNWRGCPLDLGVATSNLTSACGSDDGGQDLFAAFTMPFAVDSVVALELVVDLQAMDASLPSWWQLGPGGCRLGALTANADFTGLACTVPWRPSAQGPSVLLAGYHAGEPRAASQARIKITVSVHPDSFVQLNAGETYVAAKILLSNVGSALCAGCQVPTCLVLNSILVGRDPGAPGGNVLLVAAGPGDANRATWQGTGASCDAVPARRRTWGELKSIYR